MTHQSHNDNHHVLHDLEDAVSPINPSSVAADRAGRVNIKTHSQTKSDKHHFKRNERHHGNNLKDNFTQPKFYTDRDARTESSRCLKCADAPCTIACPTSIDVRFFMQCMSTGNYYGAAKAILTENPLGSSCGSLCPTDELCVGSCNLNPNPIHIGELQAFAVNVFSAMNIPVSLPSSSLTKKANSGKIAIIGSGPSGISCATFLSRLGYTVHIYEKLAVAGGVTNIEVPEFRIPVKNANEEIKLLTDMGVEIYLNKSLGDPGLTLTDLHEKQGYDVVYVAIGLSLPKTDPVFTPYSIENGVWNSKNFLQRASFASKFHSLTGIELPKLSGNVLVIGAGDVSIDCARTAFRCGAERVCLVMRRSINDARAALSELSLAQMDCTDILPYSLPSKIVLDPTTNKIKEIVLQQQVLGSNGVFTAGSGQYVVPCTTVITAFGSDVDNSRNILHPLKLNSSGFIDVVAQTLQSREIPWIFAGGDVTGKSTLTVEASNDGKTAAVGIHEYLSNIVNATAVGQQQVKRVKESKEDVDTAAAAADDDDDEKQKQLLKQKHPEFHFSSITPEIHQRSSESRLISVPPFTTIIDTVDISIEVAGIKFINPFGLASAPPATSAAMIRRSFENGWGFAVTKTFCLDADAITNVSPRIVGTNAGSSGNYSNNPAYLNIELISEKSASYWIRSIKQLKHDFPQHVVIASIMASYDKYDWQKLTKMAIESNCDALELNLSCPHGMGEKGMGLACGTDPTMVRDICKWVVEAANKIPVFAKLTPNVTDIVVIAKAAYDGGASGISTINTVSSMVDMKSNVDATPTPAVGYKDKNTTYGGMSGGAIRPMALRDISAVARALPGFPILGIGGVDSAEAAFEFIRCGASVVQVGSAVQSNDFGVIRDYISGLQTLLYLQTRRDLQQQGWIGQSPPVSLFTPTPRFQFNESGHPIALPHHHPAASNNNNNKNNSNIGTNNNNNNNNNSSINNSDVAHIPKLKQMVASVVNRITSHRALKAGEQVVALVNDDFCINCGRCFQTCNDNAFQAISFDPITHIPKILDTCTGCGLCVAVCPAVGALEMIPRKTVHHIKRGTLPSDYPDSVPADIQPVSNN